MRSVVGRALAASSLITLFVTSTALADDLDAAIASARGQSLPLSDAAEQLAYASAFSQAAAGKPFHADLRPLLAQCRAAGEVVGAGPDVLTVVGLLVQSPSHWHIISDPRFTAVGSGQVRGGDGRVYVSVIFCEVGAPPPPPPRPVTTRATSPPTAPVTTASQPEPVAHTVSAPNATSDARVSVLIGALDVLPPERWRIYLVPAVT